MTTHGCCALTSSHTLLLEKGRVSLFDLLMSTACAVLEPSTTQLTQRFVELVHCADWICISSGKVTTQRHTFFCHFLIIFIRIPYEPWDCKKSLGSSVSRKAPIVHDAARQVRVILHGKKRHMRSWHAQQAHSEPRMPEWRHVAEVLG